MDTVRGLNNGHAGVLYTNTTNAEDTGATGSIRSFNSDGFNLGTDGGINYSGSTYVGWAWDAGSSTVSNTDGSITSNVRANPSAGFSIVTYTGTGSNATIGHGLNAAPEFLITKDRDNAASWHVQHSAVGNTSAIFLNSTSAAVSNGAYWNNTSPTSSVFTVGTADGMNGSGNDYVAYCFAPVAGYSAMGSFTGNGSADGPFVYTGFKVAWLLLRKYDSGNNNWYLYDVARDEINPGTKELLPDTTSAENPYNFGFGDFLSNGFKIRTTEGSINSSGASVLYAAFAEHPFKTARAR